MDRTEEDKLLRASIVVTLGGKEHEIQPLVIKEAREWRKKFAQLIGKLPAYTRVTTDDIQGFNDATRGILVTMPDEMTDLFFAYAKDLDRETIEGVATEAELAKAIEAVMAVAFPLLSSMTGALGRMAR